LKSPTFVRNMFREYYNKDFSLSESLPTIEKREFGFASFESWMLRHKGFKGEEELTAFLRDFVPKDAYFSCAIYETPEAEMEKKGWLGADLIFDIDADHIPTSCNKIHDEWTCGNCGFTGKGIPPTNCPTCNSEKFDVNTWPCEVCLASAKKETMKLLDMLLQDFGFSKNEVHIFFSGHRGYHVHVDSESVRTLDAVARKEIVDYISGLGFDIAIYGGSKSNWRRIPVLSSPSLDNVGWSGRIAKGVYDFILNGKEEDLVAAGLKRNVVETVLKNKESILRNLNDSRILSSVKGVGPETWKKIAEFCVQNQSAKIDTVVTTDIHRLIRLTDALHGKTGLRKVGFSLSDINDFDPFKNAVAFKKGTVSVFVSDAPEFRLGDENFGPYKKQKVELPTAAALLLICRDRAEVVDQNV
jgi:DNA primase small subunit